MYTRFIQGDAPYVAYFISESQLSFRWTGKQGDPIEVEWGGDAEPVIAHIDTQPLTAVHGVPATFSETLNLFERICDEWAAQWGGDTTPLLRPGDLCRLLGDNKIEHVAPCPDGYSTGTVSDVRTGKPV